MTSRHDNSPPTHGAGAPGDEQLARRQLLKLTVYVAPAVIGTLLIGRTALAQTPSCAPATCMPSVGPCSPKNCKPRAP